MLPGETGKALGEAGLQEKGTTPGAGAGAGAGRAYGSSLHLNPLENSEAEIILELSQPKERVGTNLCINFYSIPIRHWQKARHLFQVTRWESPCD